MQLVHLFSIISLVAALPALTSGSEGFFGLRTFFQENGVSQAAKSTAHEGKVIGNSAGKITGNAAKIAEDASTAVKKAKPLSLNPSSGRSVETFQAMRIKIAADELAAKIAKNKKLAAA